MLAKTLSKNLMDMAGTSSKENADMAEYTEDDSKDEDFEQSILDAPTMPLTESFDLNQENWSHAKVKSSTPRVAEHRQRKRKQQEVQDEEMLKNAIQFQVQSTEQLDKINKNLEKIQTELNTQNFLKLKKLQLLCKIHNIDDNFLNLNVENE